MSLVYKLVLSDALSRSDVSAALGAIPGFVNDGECLVSVDMLVSIDKPTALEAQIVNEEFGFHPQCTVFFRLIKNQDARLARDRLIRCCATLLARVSGDAALLFNSEEVILLRRSGKLIANELPHFWTPELLIQLGSPPRQAMRTL